ncbi:DUF2802 domain-containing protein [Pseudoalteromonas shioyasakiensis]|uniref:DUF2802 domain-containing protein n=1 Tax=Pseudoalteromonas shioyasakiensis TaxID=1190813 RepID=UPI0021195637|nr:DUF2802 domain-containing protein [Pseudoalteromonas shioyasakiensis]MCQ8877867.1 DUF2802 domain-containing protein [Pseudoalteromonas shioyasakiensis]
MLLLSLVISALALVLVCFVILYGLNRKIAYAADKTQQQLGDALQQNSILRSEVAEMRAGMLSIGKRLVAVEQRNQELAQQQDAQKYDDPDAKIYSRAVKMVELGADIEEIIRECELPRAEAELLMSLHQQKGAN